MAITVEELEIIIQAKVDKVVPQIRKMMTDVKKELQDSNIDFSLMSKSINREVNKTKPIIKKLKEEFNPEEVKFTINGESMKKEIKGISNQFSSLIGSKQELANAFDFSRQSQKLKIMGNEIDSVSQKMKNIETSKIGFISYDTNKIQQQVDALSGISPSNAENEKIDKTSTKIDLLKSKFKEIIGITRKVASATKDIVTSTSSSIIKAGKLASNFLGIRKNADSLKSAVSGGVKTLIKYAGALIGIRSIYNGLKSLASEWMASNDASAKQLTANLNYIKMAIGSSLYPVIETIINLIYKAVSAVQSLIYAFTGVNIFAKMTTENYKKMASGANSASKATKQLAGIHNEINNIPDSGSSSGSGGVVSPNIDLSEVNTEMSDWFKELFSDAYTLGYNIGQKINEGLSQIPWDSIQATVQNIAYNIAMFLNGAVDGIDWSLVGTTIAQGLNTILIGVYTFLTTFNFENLGIAIATGLNSVINTFDWTLLGVTLGAKLQAIIDVAYGILTTFDFSKFGQSIAIAVNSWFDSVDWNKLATDFAMAINGIFETAKGFIDAFDWVSTAITIAEGINTWFEEIDWVASAQTISDGIKSVLDSIIFFLGSLDWGEIGASIGDFIANIDWLGIIEKLSIIVLEVFGGLGIAIITGICEGIAMAVVNIATFIWDNVVSPIIEAFKNLFGIHSPSTVMMEIGTFLIQGLFDGINSLIGKVLEIWEDLKTKVIEIVTNIKDKVVEKITNMKENAISKFNELREKAIEKVSNLKTKALDTFENLKSSISNKITSIKTTIVNGFENAVNYIKSLPSQALNWGKDLIGNIVNGIKAKIGDVRNAITEVANNIKAYLHFSEPDVGPLSDFHTYMPDMINLMKQGIERNMGSLINSVEEMAKEMSITLHTGELPEYSLSSIGSKGEMQAFTFKDIASELNLGNLSNNSNGIERLTVQIGDRTIYDKAIDYINEKSRRLGKNVIEVK